MKKIKTIVMVGLLALSVTACSSNASDKNKSNKTEDKQEDILATVKKNVQEQTNVTANLSNSAILEANTENEAKFEESGTFNCIINIDSKFDEITTNMQLTTIANDGTKLLVPEAIVQTIKNGESEIQNLGGTYPFHAYQNKFENYFTTKDEVKTMKNENSTTLEYSNDGSKVVLEINKDNMPIKMTYVVTYKSGETTYTFHDIVFTK